MTERVTRLENQMTELQTHFAKLNQRLSQPARSGSPSHGNSRTYVVRAGDSFWAISRRLNISLSSLQRANPGINPQRLAVGRTINIPGGAAHGSLTNSLSTQTGMTTYRVKKGDILGRISENHGIRLHQLMAANPGLDPRRLRVGKVLQIPGQSPSPKKHKIAQPIPSRQNTPPKKKTVPSPAPAQAYQGIQERQNPYLPNTQVSSTAHSFLEYGEEAPKPRLVPVSKDSRLSEIAKLHCTTVAQINKLNDVELSPEQMIRSGSQLYVPSH